jgi:hypothetical protein
VQLNKLKEWLKVLAKPKTFIKRGSGAINSREAGSASSQQGPSKSAEELQTELKAWLESKPPSQSDATTNAFGLAVGKTASPELRDFISVFEPMAAETPEGEVLREGGFIAADPNGAYVFLMFDSYTKSFLASQGTVCVLSPNSRRLF